MALELDLLPADPPHPRTGALWSPVVLSLDHDDRLFNILTGLSCGTQRSLAALLRGRGSFSGWAAAVEDGPDAGERRYGHASVDGNGVLLRWLTAAEIVTAVEKHFLDSHPGRSMRSRRTRSAVAYLREWTPQSPVILYWH